MAGSRQVYFRQVQVQSPRNGVGSIPDRSRGSKGINPSKAQASVRFDRPFAILTPLEGARGETGERD